MGRVFKMGTQRKGPTKKQRDVAEQVEEDVGAGENELGEADDFDHFLDTLDNSSDSEDEDDEGDPAEEDDDTDDTGDDDDDEDEGMEPEEEEHLHEDGEESEEGDDSDEQENSEEDQGEEEGEEGIPIQNGIGGEEVDDDLLEEDSDDDGKDSSMPKKELSAKSHKMDLQNLQATDPEFFAFLKENDAELLDFDESDEENDSDEEDTLHKPPESLEEASDSEAEEERMDDTSEEHKVKVKKHLKLGVVDLNVITHWQTQLSKTRDIAVFANTVEALRCAVATLSQSEVDTDVKWRVDGSANFNALLRFCIKEIKGFCARFLCGNNNGPMSENMLDQKPFELKDKSKLKWTKLRPKLKAYMDVLVQLLTCLGNSDAISSVLRHCQRMSCLWALLGAKSTKMLRTLTNIWATGEDSCRVLAFLTIIRMTNYNKDMFLLQMFKQMYIAYVANCKFTSVNTLPAINFMRSSLVELYLLDTTLAYSVAFPFIRQLAIHLRNALSPSTGQQSEGKLNKSEAFRVVYSWQFIHSLHLWVDVLATNGIAADKEDGNLKLLIYPVVQICMGTMRLVPTKKFIPIRFHIIRMLTKLQEKTGTFIPVLPHITEVLRVTNFSSKNPAAFKFSVRPLDLTCVLKADAAETGYFKAVADNALECLLLYCKAIATDLGFPEIVTPTVMYLKTFIKKDCKNAEVQKRFKLLLEKIDSNSKYISERRNKAMEAGTVTLADKKSHKILQVQMQTTKPQPPILVYATEYFKLNQKAQIKSQKVQIETKEEKLIPKLSSLQKKSGSDKSNSDLNEPMFKSDTDDSDGEFSTKLDVPTQMKKSKKRKMGSEVDDDTAETSLKKKSKKKKIKTQKKKIGAIDPEDKEFQDELVDYELSD